MEKHYKRRMGGRRLAVVCFEKCVSLLENECMGRYSSQERERAIPGGRFHVFTRKQQTPPRLALAIASLFSLTHAIHTLPGPSRETRAIRTRFNSCLAAAVAVSLSSSARDDGGMHGEHRQGGHHGSRRRGPPISLPRFSRGAGVGGFFVDVWAIYILLLDGRKQAGV